MLVKLFGPVQLKVPLPVPISMMLVVEHVSVPPVAFAPGAATSSSTIADAMLVQPFVPVTVSI